PHLGGAVGDAGPFDAVDVPDGAAGRPFGADDVEAGGGVVAPEALVPLPVAAVAPVHGHDDGVGPVTADLLHVELRRPDLAGRLPPEGAVEPGAGRRPQAHLPVAVALVEAPLGVEAGTGVGPAVVGDGQPVDPLDEDAV